MIRKAPGSCRLLTSRRNELLYSLRQRTSMEAPKLADSNLIPMRPTDDRPSAVGAPIEAIREARGRRKFWDPIEVKDFFRLWSDRRGEPFGKRELEGLFHLYQAFHRAVAAGDEHAVREHVTSDICLLVRSTLRERPPFEERWMPQPPGRGASLPCEWRITELLSAPQLEHARSIQVAGGVAVAVSVRFHTRQSIELPVRGGLLPVVPETEVDEVLVFIRDLSAPHYKWKVAGVSEPVDAYFRREHRDQFERHVGGSS